MTIKSNLRHGDQRAVLQGVQCDTLISDPPYSAKTHKGHNAAVLADAKDTADRRTISYSHWTAEDVREFVLSWSPRVSGWMAIMSDSSLIPAYEAAYLEAGRYAFAPVPCIIRGMSVRLSGDGPSSNAIYLNVARPRTKQMARWGTLPGFYVVNRASGAHIGGKPYQLMRAIVRDYSRPGDTICDPCAGLATTAVAAKVEDRSFIGAEIDRNTFEQACARLGIGQQKQQPDQGQMRMF